MACTFFEIFKRQPGSCFRLGTGKDGSDVLDPLDARGKPLLGDDRRAMTTAELLDEMRVRSVDGFLFQHRGAATALAAAESHQLLPLPGSGAIPPVCPSRAGQTRSTVQFGGSEVLRVIAAALVPLLLRVAVDQHLRRVLPVVFARLDGELALWVQEAFGAGAVAGVASGAVSRAMAP